MVEHDTRQVIQTDVSGNPEVDAAVHYQFSNIRSNVGLGDKLFDYKLPKGYVETLE